jgi:hypothetical protein
MAVEIALRVYENEMKGRANCGGFRGRIRMKNELEFE